MSDNAGEYRIVEELGHDIGPMAVIAAMAIGGALALSHMPARVAVHFGANGQPNGYAGAAFAAFFPVGMAVVVWLLLAGVPAIDPRRRSYAQFRGAYRTIRFAVVGLLAVFDATTLLHAMGRPVDVRVVVPLAMAALLAVIGNLLPKVRPSWFVGIRTPWTLSSDEVWRRTHRAAGPVFVAAAALPVIGLFLGGTWPVAAILAAVLAPSFAATVHSFWLYGRLGPGDGAVPPSSRSR